MEPQAAIVVAAWTSFADSVQQQARNGFCRPSPVPRQLDDEIAQQLFCPGRLAITTVLELEALQRALMGCKTSVQAV